MPPFVFANAGARISSDDLGNPIVAAVFIGFVLGKPIGVFSFSWLAERCGIAQRRPGLSWGFVAAGALLAGIGFTMALFIANLAFGEDAINAAKLGIFTASVIAAAGGATTPAWLSSGPCGVQETLIDRRLRSSVLPYRPAVIGDKVHH